MRKSLVFGAGQGARLAVLDLIKRSHNGLGVKQIATELGMSYMGVKAHCLALASEGYLKTWRKPSTKGRPLMLYQMAETGECLFAEAGGDLSLGLLAEAAQLFGPSAPQKILVMFFRTLAAHYNALVSGQDALERARSFVRIRDREGRMSFLREGEQWDIQESHNPMAILMEKYPEVCSIEEHLVQDVLGIKVARREEGGAVIFSPLR